MNIDRLLAKESTKPVLFKPYSLVRKRKEIKNRRYVVAYAKLKERANQMNGKGKITEKIFSAKLANQIFSLEWKNSKRQG